MGRDLGRDGEVFWKANTCCTAGAAASAVEIKKNAGSGERKCH